MRTVLVCQLGGHGVLDQRADTRATRVDEAAGALFFRAAKTENMICMRAPLRCRCHFAT